MDDLRGTPMSVGNLEEIIDDNHAIVSTSVGSEHYVSILSFVDKDQLEPGCSVLLNHKVRLRVLMGRDFWYRLIEKYFEQLIASVRVLRPHCCNSKANDFEHYCAAACAGTCQTQMR